MKFGIKNKLYINDLDFTLIQEFRKKSRHDLIKIKLLTGSTLFKLKDNNCNSIDFETKCIILPEYDAFKGDLHYVSKSLSVIFNTFFRLIRQHNNLFKLDGSNLFFIVEGKRIICIFSVASFLHLNNIYFSEENNYYYFIRFDIYNKLHCLSIRKSDLVVCLE